MSGNVYHRACKRCGEPFTFPRPKLGRGLEFCSDECRRQWKLGLQRASKIRSLRVRAERVVCGCGKAHRCTLPPSEAVAPAPEKQEASNG